MDSLLVLGWSGTRTAQLRLMEEIEMVGFTRFVAEE
jgi:hypothetical protein